MRGDPDEDDDGADPALVLAAQLRIPARYTRRLAAAGVRDAHELLAWTSSQLAAVPQLGELGQAAVREGITRIQAGDIGPVPDDLTPPDRTLGRERVALARAILDAGIPVTERRRALLTAQAANPNWTTFRIAAHLNESHLWVRREWARIRVEHPPEVIAAHVARRGTQQ
jgi:hypothetical protein